MIQGDASRFEEYVTLRQEMLQVMAQCRQIIYWTVLLVIAGLGWYWGQTSPLVTRPIFGLLLLVAIFVSWLVYVMYVDHFLWIGSFIAVFWESRDETRMLKWHRFNRRGGAVEQSLSRFHLEPRVGAIIYSAAVIIVSLGMLVGPGAKGAGEGIVGALAAVAMVLFRRSLSQVRRRRDNYETGWRRVRESGDLQGRIHEQYEGKP